MSSAQVSSAALRVASQHPVTMSDRVSALRWQYMKGVIPMHFSRPQVIRGMFDLSRSHDEHLLAGADEEAVQALGVSQPVLGRFQPDIAILCPDLVHEAQLGLGRR
jgi:hypothetical protein